MNEEEIIELVFRPKRAKTDGFHSCCPLCGNNKVINFRFSNGRSHRVYKCGYSQGGIAAGIGQPFLPSPCSARLRQNE